ncbi:MAG TPA: BlaI/MecI/CopY family transcriptional regulator, partial [Clostridia bacterium]|nr:BlaI/MecI/CopY family transcriptional regulator [Clostridia bacterium]
MKDYSISEAEWEIMKVLWDQSDITLSDIVKDLGDRNWSYSTIKTLLRRLVDKGAVDVDKSVANSFVYKAAVKEQDCKVKEANNFLQRVFDGSISMFVSTLARESDLTKEERDELIEMINRMEG